MARSFLTWAAALAAAGLTACASTPADTTSGRATLSLTKDGTIRVTEPTRGLFARRAVVEFKPGDPGYDTLKDQFDVLQSGKRKPVLTWTIGEPVFEPPA